MSKKLLILPGDGIGPEIGAEAEKVLRQCNTRFDLQLAIEHGALGGGAVDQFGAPLPESTLAAAREADAIVLGAVGGPQWDNLERSLRPEQGLLPLRSG